MKLKFSLLLCALSTLAATHTAASELAFDNEESKVMADIDNTALAQSGFRQDQATRCQGLSKIKQYFCKKSNFKRVKSVEGLESIEDTEVIGGVDTEEQPDSQRDDQQASKDQSYLLHVGLTLSPSLLKLNKQSLYASDSTLHAISKYTMRNELDFRFAQAGFNLQGVLRQSLDRRQQSEYQTQFNQAYYDGQISSGWGWTLGKKVMTWGVGFGFKPLDVIQREDVRSVNAAPLVGQYIFALDRYTDRQSYSLIVSNPLIDRPNNLQRDPSIALRWYRLHGDSDLYATARFSERRQVEAGVGMTHIIDDEWSVYASGLYQVRSQRLTNTVLGTDQYFALQDPMQWVDDGSHWKAVVGAQWTGASGLGVLLEAWYDGDAYSKKQWGALNALTTQQKNLAQFDMAQLFNANIAASSQAYLAPNLLRENALFRVSFDDRKGRKVFSDLLLTPADGGGVVSLGLEWERNRSNFKTGYRQYLSRENSAYGQAPVQSELWGQWRVVF